jgi:hydrophobic/amphiphilic exporter-1 (mainly G- bacteria), HAE1 family
VPGVEEVTSISAEGQSSVRVTFSWGTEPGCGGQRSARSPGPGHSAAAGRCRAASAAQIRSGLFPDPDPGLPAIWIRFRCAKSSMTRSSTASSASRVWPRWISAAAGARNPCQSGFQHKIKALDISMEQILHAHPGREYQSAGRHHRAGSAGYHHPHAGCIHPVWTNCVTRWWPCATGSGPAQGSRPVEDRWEKVTRIIRVNGKPGVRLAVNKQSGKNTVEVAAGVLREIESINRDLQLVYRWFPSSTPQTISSARSPTWAARFSTAASGRLRAAHVSAQHRQHGLVIVTTIPISVVATFP